MTLPSTLGDALLLAPVLCNASATHPLVAEKTQREGWHLLCTLFAVQVAGCLSGKSKKDGHHLLNFAETTVRLSEGSSLSDARHW
jgi:hypothetical protein